MGSDAFVALVTPGPITEVDPWSPFVLIGLVLFAVSSALLVRLLGGRDGD